MGRFLRILQVSAILPLISVCSCVPAGNDGFVRRTTSAANDHIMLVRPEPRTFGHQRLTALAEMYPDLGVFLSQQGIPDFLAETNKGGNRYLILYYLPSRQAFACRAGSGDSRQVEFSGPYPVTDGELATLDGLRKNIAADEAGSLKTIGRPGN